MRNPTVVAALAFGLAIPLAGTPASAQSDRMPSGMMGRGMGLMMGRMSPEDMSAFVDARIAALRAGLKLSTEQERLWPPVEEAIRGLGNLHLTHIQMMRRGQPRMEDDPISALRSMADRMTEGAGAARKLADIVERMRPLLAIEMLEAAQAIDLRRPERMGRAAAAAYALVRSVAPPLDADRPLGVEVEKVAAVVVGRGLARRFTRSA